MSDLVCIASATSVALISFISIRNYKIASIMFGDVNSCKNVLIFGIHKTPLTFLVVFGSQNLDAKFICLSKGQGVTTITYFDFTFIHNKKS
jgi:hypothetical protein